MIEAAAKMGDYLIVVVNNDKQQLLKKGKKLSLMRKIDSA
ncbi:hypothetical protein [Candidatus Minimicrobia vallesae]|nr:hypothetical protein [Candidatus Minimicrobia vallesae]